MVTGSKETSTTDLTVIKSSELITNVVEKIKSAQPELQTHVTKSVLTIEKPEVYQVVTIVTNQEKDVKITSFVDKKTNTVTVIDSVVLPELTHEAPVITKNVITKTNFVTESKKITHLPICQKAVNAADSKLTDLNPELSTV